MVFYLFTVGCDKKTPIESKTSSNTSPIASFSVTPDSGTTETVFTFDASMCYDKEDPVAALQIRWDWENDNNWDTNFSLVKTAQKQFTVVGKVSVNIEVKDNGGLSDTYSQQVTVSKIETAPTASFTVTPANGNATTDFQFDASGSSDAQDPVSTLQVRWDWENDGYWDTGYSTTKTATHCYSTDGTKTINLEVKDTGGLTNTTTRQVTVTTANTGPIASFTVNLASGTTYTDFQFDASGCIDAQDPISALQVRWDWDNDGWDTDYSTMKTSAHRYSTEGTKTIKLEVKDTGGMLDVTTRTVTVTSGGGGGTITLQWITVPGGTFTIGDIWGDGASGEKPAQMVTLSTFYMSKYEITNAQYAIFLNRYGSETIMSGEYAGQIMISEHPWGVTKSGSTWQWAYGKANFPVVSVTWYGAYEFARFYGLRLPTEAEWEYAARSGGKTDKWAGTNVESQAADYMWYWDNSGSATNQVVTKLANGLGLHDMSGNVDEWCQDWYDPGYYVVSPSTNPQGPATGDGRVLRGGSWQVSLWGCRTSSRAWAPPTHRSLSVGFRVASSRSQ